MMLVMLPRLPVALVVLCVAICVAISAGDDQQHHGLARPPAILLTHPIAGRRYPVGHEINLHMVGV